MPSVSLQHLLDACRPGGASVLTSVTPLEPAAGPHASVAPAKFVEGSRSVFAYERRFWAGEAVTAVVIDSKQSQNNRLEAVVSSAIADDDPVLTSLPRIELRFADGQVYNDFDLPHRAFDGQIRAGTISGEPATDAGEYRRLRDATVLHARPLLERSPMTLLLGGWDASRKSHQGRYRSILVGEVIGILADQTGGPRPISPSAGARESIRWACESIFRTRIARPLPMLRRTSCPKAPTRALPGETGRPLSLDSEASRRRWSSLVV